MIRLVKCRRLTAIPAGAIAPHRIPITSFEDLYSCSRPLRCPPRVSWLLTAIPRVSEVKRTRRRYPVASRAYVRDRTDVVPFGRRHPRANKLCKRQASRCRPHTPSRRRYLQQGPSSDPRRTAFVPFCRRRMRAGSAQAPCHPPMRTAAIRVRRSSMHRRPGTRWHQALWAVSINWSLDLQLHCGLLSPIALDLILDSLSLVERA